MKGTKKVGLSLSGGGYRAAAFHLGTLKKLNELGILKDTDVISTISGGSIAGVYYLLHKDDFDKFEKGLKKKLQQSVVRRIIWSIPVLLLIIALFVLTTTSWILFHNISLTILLLLIAVIIVLTFQFRFLPFTNLKAKAYKNLFFQDKSLKDLPDSPKIAINATNLETGTLWTYSKTKMGDSSYAFPKDGGRAIEFNTSDFPLALAIASSTCVPVPFNPVKIDKKYFLNPNDIKRANASLVDGGLYDNQGIHKITQLNSSYNCDIIICSDASQPYKYKFNGQNSFQVLYRGNDTMMRRIKNLQFIRDVLSSQFEIAYYSLDWQYDLIISSFVDNVIGNRIPAHIISHHQIPDTLLVDAKNNKVGIKDWIEKRIEFGKISSAGLTKEEIEYISNIPTGLSAFGKSQIELLSKHAQVLTEIQIKIYCPTLLK